MLHDAHVQKYFDVLLDLLQRPLPYTEELMNMQVNYPQPHTSLYVDNGGLDYSVESIWGKDVEDKLKAFGLSPIFLDTRHKYSSARYAALLLADTGYADTEEETQRVSEYRDSIIEWRMGDTNQLRGGQYRDDFLVHSNPDKSVNTLQLKVLKHRRSLNASMLYLTTKFWWYFDEHTEYTPAHQCEDSDDLYTATAQAYKKPKQIPNNIQCKQEQKAKLLAKSKFFRK